MLYGQSITYLSEWLVIASSQPMCPASTGTLFSNGSTACAPRPDNGTIRTRWRGLRRVTKWLPAEDISRSDPLVGIFIDKPEPLWRRSP